MPPEKERSEPPQTAPAEVSADAPGPRWRSVLRQMATVHWIVLLIVLSVIVHGIGFVCYRIGARGKGAVGEPEISLGEFQYRAAPGEHSPLTDATFDLYITLLDAPNLKAREQLAARRYRVEQDIEQLLRRAHAGDFDDPNVAELKRQIQEQINESLGMRVVADVIVTNLKLRFAEQAGPPPTTAAGLDAPARSTALAQPGS